MNCNTNIRRNFALLLLAVAISSTDAFQTPTKSTGGRKNLSCRRFAEDRLHTTSSSSSLSIISLVERGQLDDALSILQKSDTTGNDGIPASIYHAVIEACCAGKIEGRNNNSSSSSSSKSAMDRIDEAAELLQSMKEATAHAYETLVTGYARRGRWQDA